MLYRNFIRFSNVQGFFEGIAIIKFPNFGLIFLAYSLNIN